MAEEKNEEQKDAREYASDLTSEVVSKVLWVLVPIIIGGCISMFTNFQQDMQIVVWGVLFLIVAFGLWASNAKKIRRRREKIEGERWENISKEIESKMGEMSGGFDNRCSVLIERFDRIDERFDEVDKRFNEIDARFDLSENSNRALLRNELVKMHREWAEDKGYITLETLEYVDRIHDAYNAVGGNDTGDQLWKDLHSLQIRENRTG